MIVVNITSHVYSCIGTVRYRRASQLLNKPRLQEINNEYAEDSALTFLQDCQSY